MLRIFIKLVVVASLFQIGLFTGVSVADDKNECSSNRTNIKHVLEWRISARTFLKDDVVTRRDFPNDIAFRSEGGNIEKVIIRFRRDGSVTNAASCKNGVLDIVFENGQMPAILAMWDRAKANKGTTFYCAFSKTEAVTDGRCDLSGEIN